MIWQTNAPAYEPMLACLLALRDGIVWTEDQLAEAILATPSDLVTLEYFCARVPRPFGDPNPLAYIGVSCRGGFPGTAKIKHCLSDRQENDREIADMRGHYTGENKVEQRARNLAAVINVATVLGEYEVDFVQLKTRRVASSILSGLVDPDDDAERLAIRPIGDLHRVPFDVLPLSSGRPLGDHVASHYLAGPALLSRFPPRADIAGGVPLVVGACDFDDAPSMGALLQLRSRNGLFENLPGTEIEASLVCELIGGELISGPLADRDGFIRALGTPRPIIHFATHSFFVDRERHHAPEVHGEVVKTIDPKLAGSTYSSILLSGANDYVASDGSTWLNDRGLLDTSTILGLDLTQTAMVTLSSCESGIGAIEIGAELDSMREAFLRS